MGNSSVQSPAASTPTKRKRSRTNRRTNRTDASKTPPVKDNTPDAPTALPTILQPDETVKPNDDKPVASKFPPREQCLIVLNIPESASKIPQQRLDDDIKEIRSCFSSIFLHGEDPIAASVRAKAAYRLGKPKDAGPDDSGPQSRTIKVVLNATEEVQAILQRKHRIRGSSVRILRDPELN